MKSNTRTFKIKHLTNEDLATFNLPINLINMVFDEEPKIGSEANSLSLLNSGNFIAVAALAENEVLGGLTAYEMPMYYSDRSEIFLYDLAVKPEFQRMGVGKRLIQRLKEHCIKNEVEVKEFFVMAHEEDEHAIEFFRAIGAKNEKVINFLLRV